MAQSPIVGSENMKKSTDRRTVLIAAGTVAVAAVAGPAAADSTDIRGTVIFDGPANIPEGQLEIYLEDPAIADKTLRRIATVRIASGGQSKAVAFSLAPPAGLAPTPTQRVVARLQCADGWLLARGSTRLSTGSPVQVNLSPVIY